MAGGALRTRGSLLVVGFGAALFAFAVVHHARELTMVAVRAGPVLAFAFDAALALCLVYAGDRLRQTDLPDTHRWTVAVWSCAGLVLFTLAIAVTMGIRVFEGRTLSEPVFTLLVVASTGGIAGYVAGYYRARALVDADRAERATGALAFVNGVIRHDLRNDMQVIRTNADILADTAEGDRADRVAAITEKTATATDRIESTGAIVRTVTGEADFEPVDLVEVVEDGVDQLRATHDVEVSTTLPERAPVRANRAVESVVDNLLENAVEHNDSQQPRVDVSVTVDDDAVRLRVGDNGPGLSGTGDVFEMTGDDPGGLQIVATLADQYGGSVYLADDGTEGATFEVTLPRATGEHN